MVHASRSDERPRDADVVAVDPHLVLDNGADLTLALLDGAAAPNLRGGTEETTTGADLLRARPDQPPFPAVVINDSRLKPRAPGA